jgi:putative oxidoreductase
MERAQLTNLPRTRARLQFVKKGRFLARLVLAVLFVFAGATKIYDPGTFAMELERYQLLPWKAGVAVSIYLPWLEFFAGLCLFVNRLKRGALFLITMLLVVFTFALASALVRGLSIDCGCFGHTIMSTGTLVPLLRNLVLLLFAGILWTECKAGQ